MKTKLLSVLSLTILMLFTATGLTFASTSVRLQTPPGQVNSSSLNLTFVALDSDSNQTVNVDCYKKGPSDGAFSLFQSFSLLNGGNTNVCNANLNQGYGAYYFYVVANGSGNSTSATVGTTYGNSFPETPTNYSKEKINSCTNKISFRTANDSGKTVKVALYRSADSSFAVDDAHKVNTQNIGSDTDGSFTNDISPDCDKTYYYAIRAFDSYGNASGIVGDSSTVIVEVSPVPGTSGANSEQGAIPVTSLASNKNVKDAADQNGDSAKKDVLGAKDDTTAANQNNQSSSNPATWVMGHKKISLIVLFFALLGSYLVFRYWKNKSA